MVMAPSSAPHCHSSTSVAPSMIIPTKPSTLSKALFSKPDGTPFPCLCRFPIPSHLLLLLPAAAAGAALYLLWQWAVVVLVVVLKKSSSSRRKRKQRRRRKWRRSCPGYRRRRWTWSSSRALLPKPCPGLEVGRAPCPGFWLFPWLIWGLPLSLLWLELFGSSIPPEENVVNWV